MLKRGTTDHRARARASRAPAIELLVVLASVTCLGAAAVATSSPGPVQDPQQPVFTPSEQVDVEQGVAFPNDI